MGAGVILERDLGHVRTRLMGGAYFLPQPWHHVSMRPHTITLCLLATPTSADVAGVTSVKRAALSAYAEHLPGIVA